ncbi:MAG: hypothetical protein KDA79_13835 [Planctomycetaceae bacterium]|nr:hypothetical protein [Planctomycetaceae bacterium]
MGRWSLESVNGVSQPLDAPTFGTNFHAFFRLRYTPVMMDRFVETPKLDWHETIMMKEHHKNECWTFETNMYAHNPCSKTLLIWPRRYVEAYNHAAGRPYNDKGSSQLLDKNGQPVRVQDLGMNIADNGAKADAVRDYLKSKGGILQIEIHDIPSINTPKDDERKERLLVFDCGLEGGSLRLKAEQYLDVDGSKPRGEWGRGFKMTTGTIWDKGVFKEVAPPQIVSMQRAAVFTSGECW